MPPYPVVIKWTFRGFSPGSSTLPVGQPLGADQERKCDGLDLHQRRDRQTGLINDRWETAPGLVRWGGVFSVGERHGRIFCPLRQPASRESRVLPGIGSRRNVERGRARARVDRTGLRGRCREARKSGKLDSRNAHPRIARRLSPAAAHDDAASFCTAVRLVDPVRAI